MKSITDLIGRWISKMLARAFLLLGAGIIAYNTFWWNDESPIGIVIGRLILAVVLAVMAIRRSVPP